MERASQPCKGSAHCTTPYAGELAPSQDRARERGPREPPSRALQGVAGRPGLAMAWARVVPLLRRSNSAARHPQESRHTAPRLHARQGGNPSSGGRPARAAPTRATWLGQDAQWTRGAARARDWACQAHFIAAALLECTDCDVAWQLDQLQAKSALVISEGLKDRLAANRTWRKPRLRTVPPLAGNSRLDPVAGGRRRR